LTVIATRSRLMARLSGQGAMALLELDAQATEKLIAEYEDVTLAVHASPRQTVIAGAPTQVDAVIAAVEAQNRLARRVEVDVASHHPTVDPILPELRTALAGLAPTTPKIPLLSTEARRRRRAGVRRRLLGRQSAQSGAIRAGGRRRRRSTRHVRRNQPTPTPHTRAHRRPRGCQAARRRVGHRNTAPRGQRDSDFPFANCPLCGDRRKGAGRQTAGSPTSRPLLGNIGGTACESSARPSADRSSPLLGLHVELPSGRDHVWQADVGTDVLGWLADHEVHGRAVMPAAGFAEMALAAGSDALGLPAHRVTVNRLEVEQMLALDGETK